jgi:uncharacterized membrane protein YkvA (DUF1232 family)
MLELLRLLVIVGGVVLVTFMILLALPQCKLRDMLMPFVAWGFVALCAAYAISPVDALPEIVLGPFFGLFDDAAAVVMGIGTAAATIRAKKQKESARHDPYFN